MFEFFRGSKEEQQAQSYLATRPSQNAASKKEQRKIKNAQKLTRRLFIRRATTVGGAGAGLLLLSPTFEFAKSITNAGTSEPPIAGVSNLLTEIPVQEFRFRSKSKTFPYVQERDSFSADYANELLQRLQDNHETDREARIKAVTENLCLTTNNRGNGTALQIDEAGYFLTAAHNFVDYKGDIENLSWRQPVLHFYNPRTGLAYNSRAIMVDTIEDIALVYAPTAQPRNPVKGMRLSFEKPEILSPLWMIAYAANQRQELFELIVLHGKTVPYQRPNYPAAAGRFNSIAVEGMKPFGGSSGAPVIDADGVIRGIEVGVLGNPTPETRQQDYQGSILAPLSAAQNLRSHTFS